MATTAILRNDEQLEQELAQLERAADTARTNLRRAESDFAAAESVHGQAQAACARGETKLEDVMKAKAKVEQSQFVVNDRRRAVSELEPQIQTLQQEIVRRQAEAAQLERRQEFAELVKSVDAEYREISSELERLIVERVWPVTEKVQRLATQFEDLGGVQEAVKLLGILYARYPSAEGELHLARLRARGWKPAAYLGGKAVLRPVALSVQAMVPPPGHQS